MKYAFPAAVAVLFLCYAFREPAGIVLPSKDGFAVVELFTSEGCSSCPPADEAVIKLNALNKNVFILGYHVDYWDRLGWKDPFSSSAYSDRQKEYAASLHQSSLYTPEIVVNGTVQFTGSDEARLASSVNQALASKPVVALSISKVIANGNSIQVNYAVEGNASGRVQCNLVQLAAETSVRRGENEGRTLHHINIVRDVKSVTLSAATGSATLQLPAGLRKSDCTIIVFLQDKNNGRIEAAAKQDIL